MTGSTSGQLTPFGIEAVSKLEAIAKIGACADGRVCLLDFAAVQNKLGERWEARKQDVCEIISRIIQRAAGRAAIFALVKDCQFVLCFAESEKGNAAALSYRIMEEVLSHFLGTVDRRDVKVGYVTSLDGGQVMSRGLTSKEGLDSGATPMIPLKPKPKISPEPILIEDAAGECQCATAWNLLSLFDSQAPSATDSRRRSLTSIASDHSPFESEPFCPRYPCWRLISGLCLKPAHLA
jgi:hypothetical protein